MDGQLRISLYDRSGDFNFHITNFPFLSSNVQFSPYYSVFLSQLIRYVRDSSSYECFILRVMRLSNKLGYVGERFKSSLMKTYGWYGDLIQQYEVALFQILYDILEPYHIQWLLPLIRHNTNSWRFYRAALTLLPSFTYSICQILPEVFVEHLQWVRYANNDVYSSGHLVLSRLGLTDVLIVEICDTLNHTLNQLVAFSTDLTWSPILTLLLSIGSIEHLQRMRYAKRGRLLILIRTHDPVPFGTYRCFNCWDLWHSSSYIKPTRDLFHRLDVICCFVSSCKDIFTA